MRTASGLTLVAVLLVLTATIAGVGFAGGSITAAEYQYGKITICHHTHSWKHPEHTITISQHAWPAHLRHGDTEGACPTGGQTDTTATTTTDTTTTTTTTTETAGETRHHGDSGEDDDSGNSSGVAGTGSIQPTPGQSDNQGGGGNNGHGHGHGDNGNAHGGD